MDSKIQNLLGISITAVLLLFAAASFWYVSSFSKSVAPERSFQVRGEGRVVAIPDVAQITFGVVTEGGKDIGKLQQQNTEKANAIISFLKGSGVDEKDIKTQYYNISPRYQYYSCPRPLGTIEVEPCPPAEIVGYTINQSVSVKIRELEKAGDLLGGVVERGANTVSGPSFTIDDPEALQNEAREEAIVKAREKAEAIAEAGGFRLGKLLSIHEGFVSPVPVFAEAKELSGTDGAAPEIEPGSQEVTVTVTLTYEIK